MSGGTRTNKVEYRWSRLYLACTALWKLGQFLSPGARREGGGGATQVGQLERVSVTG
jgi:hypothetical protein